MKFHNVVGHCLQISDDKLTVVKRAPFDEFVWPLAFSDSALKVNEEFQVQLMDFQLCLGSGVLEIGITSDDPKLFASKLLEKEEFISNSWTLKNNLVHFLNEENVTISEEYELNLNNVEIGDVISITINEKRELLFSLNGRILGVAGLNIPELIWAFVNLSGRCSNVTLVPNKNLIPQCSNRIDRKVKEQKLFSTYSFHHQCGSEILLMNQNRTARRKNPINEFRNGVIISNKPLLTDKMFHLRIEGLINKWNGSIEFGVTIHDPNSFELPATMTNLRSGTLIFSGNSILTNGHSNRYPYSQVSLDDLKIGDEIALKRTSNGDINFFKNNKDLGVAGNIPINKNIWVVADLYGKTIKVSISTNETDDNFDSSNLVAIDSQETLKFHNICGKNVEISDDRCTAKRKNEQEFNNGIVFTNRQLKFDETFTVILNKCATQWSGNFEIGVTNSVPESFNFPSTMTDLTDGFHLMLTANGIVINGRHISQIQSLCDIKEVSLQLMNGIPNLIDGNSLGIQLIEGGRIQFYMNGENLGTLSVQTPDSLYGVADLYGKASEVSICTRKVEIFEPNSVISNEINESFPLYDNLNDDIDIGSLSEEGIMDILQSADQAFLRLLSQNIFDDQCYAQCLKFHEIHGRNVILSNGNKVAYRPSPNNEFKNALVMSSRPLGDNEIFEIKVDKLTDHWSGSLEVGVTLVKPEELNFPGTLSQLDKDCWILSGTCLMNSGITARNDYGLDMDGIVLNSKIGIIRYPNGRIHFLFDGKDMGPAFFNVPNGIYAILDLYGQCSQISITENAGTRCSSILDRIDESSVMSSCANSKATEQSNFKTFQNFLSSLSKNVTGNKNDKPSLKESNSKQIAEDTCLFGFGTILGAGVTSDTPGIFYAHNQNLNCVIQSSYSLTNNVYYEFLCYNDKTKVYNMEPVSFGMCKDRISSERYLPDNLFSLSIPSLIINKGKIFFNNRSSYHLSPTLKRLKNQISIGLFLYDNCLEIFVDKFSVGRVILEFNQDVHLILNLKSWYNTVLIVESASMPTTPSTQGLLKCPLPQWSHDIRTVVSDTNLENSADCSDVDNSFLMNMILDEIYQLLPIFIVNVNDVNINKIMDKIINSNEDIVRNVQNGIKKKYYAISSDENPQLRNEIRYALINEISIILSNLSELRDFGNSTFEIARFLQRNVQWHAINYCVNDQCFVSMDSCVSLDGSNVSRTKGGSDYGLVILNQELKMKTNDDFEIQLLKGNANGQSLPISLGIIIIENVHFKNYEDVFKFLKSLSCPKKLNFLSNYITDNLQVQKYESPPIIILIEDDCIYYNRKKIFQNMSFNVNNISPDDYISFNLLNAKSEMAHICVNVRNNNTTLTSTVFSQSLISKKSNMKPITTQRDSYYYVPFFWLKEQSSITIHRNTNLHTTSNYDVIDHLTKKHSENLSNKEESLLISPEENKINNCPSYLKAAFVKSLLTIPEIYLPNKLGSCFCNSCRSIHFGLGVTNSSSISELLIKGEPAKEFRLPLGWIKFNFRVKKDLRYCLSLWHLAYLTLPIGLLNRFLTAQDPVHFLLKAVGNTSNPDASWMKPIFSQDCDTKLPILVSPWEPLGGTYLNKDDSICQCSGTNMKYLDCADNCYKNASIALEVRIKPGSYRSKECMLISQSESKCKKFLAKETESKISNDISCIRSINQKTLWILNGEPNSLIISGLLIQI